jgi:hypothetical protein
MRRLLRRLPQSVRWRWHRLRHHHVGFLRNRGPSAYVEWAAGRALLWAQDRWAASSYATLSSEAAARARRSDTVFVFGSGYSLNELSAAEWAHIAEHDVFGFSGFAYQTFVRTDYHFVRSWLPEFLGVADLCHAARAYGRRLCENPRFAHTIFLLQREYSAEFSNALVATRSLPPGARLLRYHAARRLDDLPTDRWHDGVSRDFGTLVTVVNVAYLLGWRRIVLVGVDLYDNRHFWGPPAAAVARDDDGEFFGVTTANEHGVAWHQPHHTTRLGVVSLLEAWAKRFAARGAELIVYNPRSLLAEVLPVYGRGSVAAATRGGA